MRTDAEIQVELVAVESAKKTLAKYISRLVKENLEEDQLKEADNISEEAANQLEEIDSDIIDLVQTECFVDEESEDSL